jgi:ribonuclease BN (tRNA processing enzyme)
LYLLASDVSLRVSPRFHLVCVSSQHSIVLDAGDGLFGQLAACFEDEGERRCQLTRPVDAHSLAHFAVFLQFAPDLRELLLSIRLVWVSHKHADHQCGLPRLLAEIRRLHGASIPEVNKVTVVAPHEIVSYTFFVGCLSGHDDLIDCVTCSDMNESSNPSLRRLRCHTAGAIQSVHSTRVEHCHDAYAVKLVLLGKYVATSFMHSLVDEQWPAIRLLSAVCVVLRIIIYSGDCRPNSKLPKIGEHCDLLIHEATFDDQLAADAVKKRHCTVGEAVGVAQQMRARCCVLTHFSQRYPVIPATPAQHGSDGACCVLSAWDYFTFCLVSEQHSASQASNRAAAILAECTQLLNADDL